MKRIQATTLAFGSVVLLASSALAQTNIDPDHKFSWGENCGWMNWRDAGDPNGVQGARFHATFLSGFVWGENIGWINLGDGTPVNGTSYANVNGADSGVNLNAGTGNLSGMAWGENIGWINFSGGALAAPPNPARLNANTGRLRGYAWGENIGWINLDHAVHFVAIVCAADFDGDGFVTGLDFDAFVAAFEAGDPSSDFDGDGFITGLDFDAFVLAFEAGC